jgi:hypothetical protein
MDLLDHDADGVTLRMSREEAGVMHQALNESLSGYGLDEWDFPTRMGTTREATEVLMKELGDLLRLLSSD